MPIVSIKPIVLPTPPERGEPLRVRISAPAGATGELPLIVLSHGFGSSLEGYGPLADHWAANGFVVVQPTFLDSRTVGLAPEDPRTPGIWRRRIEDVRLILGRLDLVEGALDLHLDRGRIAAAGHSFGGQTTGALLGLRIEGEDFTDPRVRAGVLLATAGRGGDVLTPYAAEHLPFLRNVSFEAMRAPALVVAGDKDDSPLSTLGPGWMADPYHLSPGRKSLLTVFGGEHMLGGISGYEVAETTDENPERVALIQRVTTAYLRHELGLDPEGPGTAGPLGELISK
jgi:predicted dienelactone hydrolase